MDVVSAEEILDGIDMVEDVLAKATGDIYDMLRRKGSRLALTQSQRDAIVKALHIIDGIEVGK